MVKSMGKVFIPSDFQHTVYVHSKVSRYTIRSGRGTASGGGDEQ